MDEAVEKVPGTFWGWRCKITTSYAKSNPTGRCRGRLLCFKRYQEPFCDEDLDSKQGVVQRNRNLAIYSAEVASSAEPKDAGTFFTFPGNLEFRIYNPP